MLITGGSKYNQHQGDTYIRNGSLAVEGNIQVGTTSSGTYYQLPNEQGDVGDVLKIVSNNTAGWGDQEFPSTASMIGYVDEPKTVYTPLPAGVPELIWNSFAGTTQVSLKGFQVGAVWEMEFEGVVEVKQLTGSLSFITENNFLCQITESGTLTNVTDVYAGYLPNSQTGTVGTTYYNNFRLKASIIRLDTTTIRVMFSGNIQETKNPTGSNIPNNYYQDRPVQKIGTSFGPAGSQDIPVVGDINQLDVKFYFIPAYAQDTQVQQYPIVQNGTYKIYNISNLPTGGLTTDDHLALNNLNAGADQDGGHTQLVALNGRTGGQTIIGGKQTGDNLELKSNSATPLANHILLGSALDTKFHRIFSSNPATPLVIEHDSILDSIRLKISGSDKFEVNQNENLMTQNLRMSSYGIYDTFEVRGANGNPLRLSTFTDGTGIEIEEGGDVKLEKNINMDSNNILGTTQLEVLNITPLAPATALQITGDMDLNNNALTDVNYIQGSIGSVLEVKSGDPGGVVDIWSSSGSWKSSDGVSTAFSVDTNITNTIQIGTGINLDLNNNNITNVSTINGIQPSGGLSAGITNSATLSASTLEQSILPIAFVGSRQVPANTFKQGDSFSAVLAGNFGSNNGDTLTIRLKGGLLGGVTLATIVIPLNASSAAFFEAEIDFTIRNIGGAGTAILATNFDFTYNQSAGGNFQGQRLVELNNTTFSTTILNEFEVTGQFSSANANNTITTILTTLTKTY